MGFLDRLLSREAKKIISNVVDNVVDKVKDNVNDNMNSTTQQNSSYGNPTSRNQNTYAAPSCVDDPDEQHCECEESVVRARIEKIAAEEWSGYELRRDIPASEMGASPEARDYSYGLYLNGNPVAMILILDIDWHYRKKDVILAHEACEKLNVFCMNLLLPLPNYRSYISKRLRDNVAK